MTRFVAASGLMGLLLMGVSAPLAVAQSSSLLRAPCEGTSGSAADYREETRGWAFTSVKPADTVRPMTRANERVSLIAVPAAEPRKFKPHDLISIIVRQKKRYEAEAEFDRKNKWEIEGGLQEWFRFYPRTRLGSDSLSNGDPTFKFDYQDRHKAEGDNERRDTFETRIGAKVIDVKPNGNLVLEAKSREQHDEEIMEITLTGVCRVEDVSPSNSILSSQIAEIVIIEKNAGAVRDASKRGWVPRILDWLKPF